MPEINFSKGPIVIGAAHGSEMAATPRGVVIIIVKDGERCELLLPPDEATGLGVAAIIASHASRQLAAEEQIAAPLVRS